MDQAKSDQAKRSIEIYQFHVVVRHTSPHIWRRLLVRSDITIADLHQTIRIALGWADSHPHRFLIRGKVYCGNPVDSGAVHQDPHPPRLADFLFLPKERFLYEYDYPPGSGPGWQHQVRFERTLPLEAGRFYPVCMGGVGTAPPEHCSGPDGLAEFRELFTPRYILHRLAGILDDGPTEQGIAELRHLRPWITLHQFDRRRVNRQLQPAEPASIGRGQGERNENPDPHYHPV